MLITTQVILKLSSWGCRKEDTYLSTSTKCNIPRRKLPYIRRPDGWACITTQFKYGWYRSNRQQKRKEKERERERERKRDRERERDKEEREVGRETDRQQRDKTGRQWERGEVREKKLQHIQHSDSWTYIITQFCWYRSKCRQKRQEKTGGEEEKERQTDRQTDKQKERERERESVTETETETETETDTETEKKKKKAVKS